MSEAAFNNKRIAKNSLLLYIRMAVVMIVSLFTSRIILQILGVTAFGVWSLVFTVISSISFITTPLAAATQRFMNFELARNNIETIKEIFRTSSFIYLLAAGLIIIIFETVGLWFLNYRLDIPQGYIPQVNIIYQFAVFSFAITLLRLPFDATIIAQEKFNFIAICGIVEVLLKLIIVYLLLLFPNTSHLILLAGLTFIITLILGIAYVVYTIHYFSPYIAIGVPKNRKLTKDILSFSGWNTFGAFSTMTSNQGISILVNTFFGVVINAAIGISTQIMNAITQFVSNFQTAFQPQIIKRYSANETKSFVSLIEISSKISFLLVFIVGCPIIFNIDLILSLWLTDVPPDTNIFAIYVIIIIWIEALGGPFWMAIHATGNIKLYQILISMCLLLTIIISYIFLKLHFPVQIVYQIRLAIAIICLAIRIAFLKKQINISVKNIIYHIIVPVTFIGIIGSSLLWCFNKYFGFSPILNAIFSSTAFFIILLPIVLYSCFSKNQRSIILSFIKRRFSNNILSL